MCGDDVKVRRGAGDETGDIARSSGYLWALQGLWISF